MLDSPSLLQSITTASAVPMLAADILCVCCALSCSSVLTVASHPLTLTSSHLVTRP
jgi:succinate dehydrogenase/fumarate reductase-like Fe-S protein